MPFVMTMPKLSPTMTEGVIANWIKKEGEYVEAGDVLLEISTDKATVEHAALDPGWLRKIVKAAGEKAEVNEPLAIFTEQENETFDEKALLGSAPVPAAPQEAPKAQPITKEVAAAAPGDRLRASPLARKLAQEQQIDLASLQGSGPGGRIMKRDLEKAAPQPRRQALGAPATVTEEQLTPMRKVIGARLQASKQLIPHFYITQEVDAEVLVMTREEWKKRELNCTINDFIVKAVACALVEHPEINCGFNEEKQCLLRYGRIDICVAVTIPGGLITPIVTEADKRTILDIAQTIKGLATRAKENKLRPEEYQGGSFTISNLGMFGTTEFIPIVNPPQAAILGVGAVHDQAVVKNGLVVPGKRMILTLSCDHRIVDGVAAAQFMKTLKEFLECPSLLALGH